MFKLTPDSLVNFRGIQTILEGLSAKIADILRRLSVVESTPRQASGGVTLPIDAVDVDYDNSTSGLTATDVQDAIDELAASGGSYSPPHYFDILNMYANDYTLTNASLTLEKIACSDNSLQGILWPVIGTGLNKIYFEVLMDNLVAPNNYFGIGVTSVRGVIRTTTPYTTHYVGQTSYSFAYWTHGQKYIAGVSTSGYATASDGDTIGVAIDCETGKIWFAVNNTWIEGDPSSGTTPSATNDNLKGHFHAHLTPYVTGSKGTVRGRSSGFTYSPPTGFVAAFD